MLTNTLVMRNLLLVFSVLILITSCSTESFKPPMTAPLCTSIIGKEIDNATFREMLCDTDRECFDYDRGEQPINTTLNGVYYTCYENAISEMMNVKNGIKEGMYVDYMRYGNKGIKRYCNLVDGYREKDVTYYENGQERLITFLKYSREEDHTVHIGQESFNEDGSKR